MPRGSLLERRDALNRRLAQLEDELAATPMPARSELLREMEALERELRDLAVEIRNRTSMEGGSEA